MDRTIMAEFEKFVEQEGDIQGTELEEEFVCPCEQCSNQSPKED